MIYRNSTCGCIHACDISIRRAISHCSSTLVHTYGLTGTSATLFTIYCGLVEREIRSGTTIYAELNLGTLCSRCSCDGGNIVPIK